MIETKIFLTFAILGYNCTVKSPAGNLDWPFAKKRFHETRRVAIAFIIVAQPSKFTLQ